MGVVAVLVAAIASYAWGAVWYMALAKPWMKAAGLSPEDVQTSNPLPFILSFVMTVLVSGMTRHVMAMSGLDGPLDGLGTGLGLGLFIAAPWIVTNYAFAQRPAALSAIDGAYAVVGCSIIGLVHGLF